MRFEDALHEVMQHRRYNRLMGRTSDMWEGISNQIERMLTALFDRFTFDFPAGRVAGNAIPFLFALAGGILLAVGMIVIVRMLIHAYRPKKYDLSDIFEELKEHDYTVADLLLLSAEAADRRFAIRYRYIAALLSLNEREIIHIRPSATNALILREIKTAYPTLAQPFTAMAHTFHLSWFGYKNISDGDFTHFCAAGDALTEARHE